MHLNPFTPSEIASSPDDFFGRSQELNALERSLQLGSVAIQGAIGIGKSSLLARARLMMEGFDSNHSARSVVAVGDKDIQTIDQAARLLLESFVRIDERQKKVKFQLKGLFEVESAEIVRNFTEGRHLAVLKRVVEKDYLERMLDDRELLILAVDEADKCPAPLARLFRSVITHTQQQGVKQVRFVFCGVSPFYQDMVQEDPGISRFIYKTITLQPMAQHEAADLIHTKLALVAADAEKRGIRLAIDPQIPERVLDLSGGHPHIIQLLGSHLIENECEDPDAIIDSADLVKSLRRICYDDRARVYDTTIHTLELYGMLDPFLTLLGLMSPGFPSRVSRRKAQKDVRQEEIQWLAERNIISTWSPDEYGLVDEFLRIRFMLDAAESATDEKSVELYLLERQEEVEDRERFVRYADDPFYDEEESG
ncbi:MAG TPA: hypothetical protein VF297_03285 [Pyrinomonadaceae bacterium]